VNNTKTVFVGLSGGVDSSVAALRLKNEGYNVVGVFIKVWHPDFLECNWEAERLDAMRVAAKLHVPFLTCDAEEVYRNDVADYFIHEYELGRTPNPDVMCNKYVKFGAFLHFAKKHGADYVATGHYAQNIYRSGKFELHRGVDTNKDQSYFLWTLTQEQLSKVLLPVGNSTKNVIRKEADEMGLITAAKKDSQGICFLGQIDIPEFLSHYIALEEGDVLNENGEVIGTHKGALVYTKGQRHGFSVTNTATHSAPHYAVSRNIKANTITVSNVKQREIAATEITLSDCNYIAYVPEINDTIAFQSRYRQKVSTGIVQGSGAQTLQIQTSHETEGLSEGQSCVLYRGSQCLGGGIIAGCRLP